jgi:hypothetical protein
MSGSIIGTLGVIRRSAIFLGAIGLFFGSADLMGQTTGSPSNAAAPSQYANDSSPQDQRLGVDILSDTQGVDFGPYMKQALGMIKNSWTSSRPAGVKLPNEPQTETVIRFTIGQDGAISAMQLDQASRLIEVDRAAWVSITGVERFPSLPADFHGPNLILRISFKVKPPQP